MWKDREEYGSFKLQKNDRQKGEKTMKNMMKEYLGNDYTENHLEKTFAKIFSNDEMFYQYQPHEFLYHIKK